MKKDLPTVYYVADPLCGWCYGFTPVVNELMAKYGTAIEWRFLLGGMAVGDKVKPMADMANELRPALDHIADRTGADFKPAFYNDLLAKEDVLYDSLLPCLSLIYLYKNGKASWPALLSIYHKGIFQLGLAPSSDVLLALAADAAQLPAEGLWDAILETDNVMALREEFAFVRELKVGTFPSLVIELADGERLPIIEGYASFSQASHALDRLLSMHI
jgi:putative protein-disulfide isomerase